MLSRTTSTSAQAATRQVRANAEEAALIRRIATGDARAFERLYRDYFPRLTRFLYRMMRRPALVEEILNDTMLVVSQKAATFDSSARVSTWIFSIAYRKGLKALRDLDDPVESGPELGCDNGPREELMRLQLRKVLFDAVDALSVDHRTVIELTYFHGVGYREIATIMGCPIDTVKTRMFHARRRLRALLPDRMEEVS